MHTFILKEEEKRRREVRGRTERAKKKYTKNRGSIPFDRHGRIGRLVSPSHPRASATQQRSKL
jgi:hypothetical protein